MAFLENPAEWILGFVLIFSSLGVILAKKPVHSSLCFLLTLMTLATLYLQLSAEFIAIMQVLVYAGAILVLFMFVMMLFQDADHEIKRTPSQSFPFFLFISGAVFILGFIYLGKNLLDLKFDHRDLPAGFGTVESLGKALYLDFFFPFEAVVLIFIVAIVGALYTAKKVK